MSSKLLQPWSNYMYSGLHNCLEAGFESCVLAVSPIEPIIVLAACNHKTWQLTDRKKYNCNWASPVILVGPQVFRTMDRPSFFWRNWLKEAQRKQKQTRMSGTRKDLRDFLNPVNESLRPKTGEGIFQSHTVTRCHRSYDSQTFFS